MNRRSFLKKAFGTLLGILGISGGGYYYAKEIEPIMLEHNKEIIHSTRIPSSFHDFKIIQFSDTHVGFHYTLDQLKKLVKKMNMTNPNMVVFTGDLIDAPQSFKEREELITILSEVQATEGKYWIYGNHDHGGFGTDMIHDIMTESAFELLQNKQTTIQINNDRINLTGIDDVILGTPDLAKTLDNVNTDLFTILLAHEPDYADEASKYPIDIQLSGHSHGGQVRLPFIGHLYTPAYAEKYIQGKYQLNDRFQLIVSRGIGTTRLPYRFLCKPEFHEYVLKNSQK